MWRNWVLVGLALPALAVGTAGFLEATGQVPLPLALRALSLRLPVLFTLHMAASSLALILICAALSTRTRPALHRPIGRLAVGLVMLGGAGAVPSALLSDAGSFARAGFLVQAVLWLGFAAKGLYEARRRRFAAHRTAMAEMAAVASGAVLLRLMLAAALFAGLDVHSAYGWIAWLSWLLPLVAVAILIRAPSAMGRVQSAAGHPMFGAERSATEPPSDVR